MTIAEPPPVIHVRSPEEKTTRDKKFWDWILELDHREAEHCKKNPEKAGGIITANESMLKALPPAPKVLGKRNVILSEVGADGWSVLLDGVCESFFFGPNARERATKRVNELLNEKF